jgi:predicted dehydrogenase
MTIRIGIIGLSADNSSWTSRGHIIPLKTTHLSSLYKLTAIATSSAATATPSAAVWRVPPNHAHHSGDSIAADSEVDLVVVSVKLPMHKEPALPALNAGKDVLVEWPLANGLKEVEELVEAARVGGGRAFVGLQARCSPTILKVLLHSNPQTLAGMADSENTRRLSK